MREALVADIGGTNARFAIARQADDGAITLSHQQTLPVADYSRLEDAFSAWRNGLDVDLPDVACMAIAGPVEGPILRFANIPWVIEKAVVASGLGLKSVKFINDFYAISKSVTEECGASLSRVFGPVNHQDATDIISVIGPGTGLGVAILNGKDGTVIPTEGGHIGFAPNDSFEDNLLQSIRREHERVSAERVVAGPGLAYFCVHADDCKPANNINSLWSDITSKHEDDAGFEAFSRWAAALGSVCGDIALSHGAMRVVLAGGVMARVRHRLPETPFYDRFCQKGRFRHRMEAMPILAITTPEPGLLGAAVVAFAEG